MTNRPGTDTVPRCLRRIPAASSCRLRPRPVHDPLPAERTANPLPGGGRQNETAPHLLMRGCVRVTDLLLRPLSAVEVALDKSGDPLLVVLQLAAQVGIAEGRKACDEAVDQARSEDPVPLVDRPLLLELPG